MNMFLLASASAEASAGKTAFLLVDILVIVWLVGGMINGGKRGFVDCFFRLISTIAALVLAILLATWVLDLTNGMFGLQDKLSHTFSGSFDSIEGFNEEVYDVERLQMAIDRLKLPKALGNLVIKYFNKNYTLMELELNPPIAAEVFGGTIAELLCLVIAGIVLFIVAKILLALLRKALTALVEKITLANVLNVILGVVMGAIQTLLSIYVILSILSALPIASVNTFISNCTVLGYLASHNLVLMLIGALL